MFLKRTTKTVRGKSYTNHLLVESISTPKGPRHRTICSLGSLAPAPREHWLALAHRLQAALSGQASLLPDPQLDSLVEQVQHQPPRPAETEWVEVLPDQIEIQQARQAGPVYVGHQMWARLGLEAILEQAGLKPRARLLTEVMVLNRLVKPCSELAMVDWVQRTALADLLGTDLSQLNEDALYRNLDKLHPQREFIEAELAQQERTLFQLAETVYLYDLTSTYFEGQCRKNPKAKRGYSRDKRPDCKQVLVGLVVDSEGFPKAHEVFAGDRNDSTTVREMLTALDQRLGTKPGATVTVDRGMAYDHNLEQIRQHGHHYLVAARPEEREQHRERFEDEQGWEEIARVPSPRNPAQKKTPVLLKLCPAGEELHVLCVSEQRKAKDRAIRERQQKQLLADLQRLANRIAKRTKKPLTEAEVQRAIGRLQERYPRVSRYYEIDYDHPLRKLSWQELADEKQKAERLDGGYLLKTDRKDMTKEEIWSTYILLTRVENAFRTMKSPLMERPIFHQLERRVEAHIFLCVLAYHLLVSIEKMFLDAGIHTSWATIREQLSTHQVVTVVLPTSDGNVLRLRKATTPEPEHKRIYETLRMPDNILQPVKTWQPR
ncbi:MAG: IS1634 family transposase [bacterium]|nr:IS1634 family transposase [bacterium]